MVHGRKNILPISPEEVAAAKLNFFPEEVIKAFNDWIVKEWNGQRAVVDQEEVKATIIKQLPDIPFDIHWLDIGEVYRTKGWSVTFCTTVPGKGGNAAYVFTKAGAYHD